VLVHERATMVTPPQILHRALCRHRHRLLRVQVCNHRFHNECLQKWGDSSCPVCRYSVNNHHTSSCQVCAATADLWMCLLCGHVGCGRYQAAHARDHYTATDHCYSLEVNTGRVWDYVGDGYVHRLIQSQLDGKLVELPSPGPSAPHRHGPGSARRNSEASDRAECGKGCAGHDRAAGAARAENADNDLARNDDLNMLEVRTWCRRRRLVYVAWCCR
jgi:Zn-finger in ubiquitin-hydrolases and other protein